MDVIRYFMLAVFFLSAGIHLYASWKKDKPLRNKTKPIIVLSLLVFYCCTADPILLTVVAALFFSWLGDVLLIPKGNKWFTAGGIAFIFSHIFFIISYARQVDFKAFSPGLAVLLVVFFVSAALLWFRYLRPHLPEKLFYPMLIYLIINGLMNCFAWFRSLTIGGAAGFITALGALLFFVSDSTLFYVRFHKRSRLKTHFTVMLTYILAEFLIVLGLLMK